MNQAASPASLPDQLTGVRSPIIWGVGLLVAIEATVLALFVTSYFYLRLASPEWPPPGVSPPDPTLSSVATALLVVSVVPAWLGLRALRRGRAWPLALGLPLGLALAAAYLALTALDYARKDYLWTAHAYGSLDWSMSAYAALHVIALVMLGGAMWVLVARGHFGPERYTGIQALVFYWIFVIAGSLLFFGTQYLTPHITAGGGG